MTNDFNGLATVRQRNDLEGVREELKELYENKEEEGKQAAATANHTQQCGCEECFWEEKNKIDKLTEKTVTELIENFIKNRKINPEPKDKQHRALCMCAKCIAEKVEKRKEEMIKELLELNNKKINRDPRTNKDPKPQK